MYQVIFNGRLVPGATEASARAYLAGSFILEPIKIASLAFDGSDTVLHEGPSKPIAREMERKLTNAGLQCSLRRRSIVPHAISGRAKAAIISGVLAGIAFVFLIMSASS